MKLSSYRHAGKDSYGVVAGDHIIDVAPIASNVGTTLREALERNALGQIAGWAARATQRIALEAIQFLPVIPDPQKILCVGINYRTHVQETGREIPGYPMIFTRF